MPAYASVFVGISVLKRPTVIGTFLGALLIALMKNGFQLLGWQTYEITLITGMVLIVAIVISKTDFRELARRLGLAIRLLIGGQTP